MDFARLVRSSCRGAVLRRAFLQSLVWVMVACSSTQRSSPAATATQSTAATVAPQATTDAEAPSSPELADGPVCPRPLVTVDPGLSFDAILDYTRTDWLADSLAVASIVVRGEVVVATQRLLVTEVLCGAKAPNLFEGRAARIVGPRYANGSGVWILAATEAGYFSLNPTNDPLTATEWQAFLGAHPTPSVDPNEHEREVHFGSSVPPNSLLMQLRIRPNTDVFTRILGAEGIRQLVRGSSVGHRYHMEFENGRIREISHEEHGQLHGTTRRYHANGSMAELIPYREDRVDGVLRRWNEAGVPVATETYEHGLRTPIERYTGPTENVERAELVRTRFGATYVASPEMGRRIRVGMTARQVVAILRQDVSLAEELSISLGQCENERRLIFRRGRVAQIETNECSSGGAF